MTDNRDNNAEEGNEPSDSAAVDNEMVHDLESAFAELNIIEVVK